MRISTLLRAYCNPGTPLSSGHSTHPNKRRPFFWQVSAHCDVLVDAYAARSFVHERLIRAQSRRRHLSAAIDHAHYYVNLLRHCDVETLTRRKILRGVHIFLVQTGWIVLNFCWLYLIFEKLHYRTSPPHRRHTLLSDPCEPNASVSTGWLSCARVSIFLVSTPYDVLRLLSTWN